MQPDAALRMVYQPVVDLDTRRVEAFEALARFSLKPPRPPDVWFAEATAAGVGVELECRAITLALGVLPLLPGGISLAVNASPAAIASGRVARTIADKAPSATNVIVEVTEHVAVEDYDALRRRLTELRAVGARVAVDDAGVGISRLPHIAHVRPDVVKLDRSLTAAVAESAERAAYARALVVYGADLDIRVVAEGVESDDEADALRRAGVRFAQGFRLGPPADMRVWLAALSRP